VTYRRKDAYHRRARAEGYRARSAYKLVELDRRFGLLRPGDHVVDLGAWPGGWLQVALERIGARGRVVGVDLAAVQPLTAPNAVLLAADVRDPGTAERLRDLLGRPADVVLSDLAPKLTGVRATDEAHTAELAAATVALLPVVLAPGGRLLMKAFMSPDHRDLVAELRRRFERVHATRPDATRRGSAELYLVGLGHRHPPASPACG
jgi:23S rRNA (uridine2552-2'-O)-methyltransferase